MTIAVAGFLLLAACGGSESTTREPQGATLADPKSFAEAVADPATVVLNVHTPDEGSIPGTDAEIPFDQLRTRATALPEDRSTPLAVYCKSGRMSAEAVKTLADLGFTDITELAGGMQAWEVDGRTLLPPDGAAAPAAAAQGSWQQGSWQQGSWQQGSWQQGSWQVSSWQVRSPATAET